MRFQQAGEEKWNIIFVRMMDAAAGGLLAEWFFLMKFFGSIKAREILYGRGGRKWWEEAQRCLKF